jgi:hypothetical protein
MSDENVHFNKLALNEILVLDKFITQRKETWDETIEFGYQYEMIALGRATHLYYSNELVKELEAIAEKLNENKKITKVRVLHETSLSGIPYQIRAEYIYDKELINIAFDGICFFMTIDKSGSFSTLNDVIKATGSELGFRNECLYIVKQFGFEIYVLHDPFWDIEIDSISSIGLSTDTEYPAIKFVCNDETFMTLTNYGDKMVGSSGRRYYVYVAESKKFIRDRLMHEDIVNNELNSFCNLIKNNNRAAIDASIKILSCLKSMPGNIITFARRTRNWQKLKGIPSFLLDIESRLPKYKGFVDLLTKEMEKRNAFINVPKTIWVNGENHDEKLNVTRDVPNFYILEYNNGKILNTEKIPCKPAYSYMMDELKEELDKMSFSVSEALSKMNNAISLYSTNFGFDALWIAIIAIIIAIIPIIIT